MAFGGVVKLTGESEYRRALQSITQNLKVLSSEMKLVSSSYDRNDKSAAAVSAKTEVLNQKLAQQSDKLSVLTKRYNEVDAQYGKSSTAQQKLTDELTKERAKLEEIGASLGKSSKEYQEQQKVVSQLEDKQISYNRAVDDAKIKMNSAQAEVNRTKTELEKLSKTTQESSTAYKSLHNSISQQESKLQSLKREYASVVLEQGESSKAAKDLAKQIDSLSSELQESKTRMSDAEKAADKLDKSLDTAGASAKSACDGFSVLKGTLANLVSNGIQRVASAIKNQLGAAVSRVDTINAYKKTMQNLGYATEDVSNTTTRLKEGIEGLPTTLPSIMSVQQQYAALTGNLEEATDLTLALNNATLAGGQGQEIANSALTQWYQMIAAGKPDLQSWRIINAAMPAQLNQIAEALMGSGSKAQDFFEAWKKGTVTTEQVKQALIKLNTEGGGSLASFEEQAADSTGGIETSLANVKTAIANGIAGLLDEIGSENIAKAFDGLKSSIESFSTVIKGVVQWLIANKEPVIAAISAVVAALALIKITKFAKEIVSAVGLIKGALATLAANPIVLGIAAIAAAVAGLVAGFKYLWENCEDFRNFWINLWDVLKKSVEVAWNAITKAFEVAWNVIKAIWNAVKPYFQSIWDSIVAVFNVVKTWFEGMFKAAWEAIKAVWNVVTSYFKAIWDTIVGIFSVVKNVLSGNWKDAWEAIKNIVDSWGAYFQSIWDGIKNVFDAVKNWFADTFKAAWEAVKNVFATWGEFFGGLWNTIKDKFTTIGTNIADAISGAVKTGINGVIGFIERTINKAVSLINGAIDLINNIPGVEIGKIDEVKLPRLARGGVLDKGARTVIAGEDGAEAVVPLEKNTKWIKLVAAELQRSLIGGVANPYSDRATNLNSASAGNLVVNIENFVNNRPQDVQAFAKELEFYSRRSSLALG